MNFEKALRKRGWKQKDLARELGVTPGYVSKLIRGKVAPPAWTLMKMKSILGRQPRGRAGNRRRSAR